MKTLIHSAAFFVFTFIVGLSLQAESLTGITMIEEYALHNNIEYKTALLNTLKAYNNLEYFFTLDESQLSLSGSYSPGEMEPEVEAAVSLPLFQQLSLNASANKDLEGSIGIKLTPLAHSDSIEQTKLDYASALASAESAADEVKLSAVEDYLGWATAVKTKETAEKTADIKKIIYDDQKIRMESGEAVLDDVREAFIEWTAARTSFNKSVTDLQQAETDLYSTLNADSEGISISPPESTEITEAIRKLQASISPDALTTSESWEVAAAEIATESLEKRLAATWFFEPELNIGGSLSLSPSLSPEFSATLSITAGLDDFKGEEIIELQTELALSREKEARTAADQSLKLRQTITETETARLNYEKAEVEFEQAGELYLEAKFLHGLGEYSAAELEETRLLLETSKNSLFTAAAQEYTALRRLLTFSP